MNKIELLKSNTEKKHVCLQCGSAFNRPYRLKQHEKIHQNIKQFLCGEPNCNKSYSNKSHLDRHIESVHLESTATVVYSCPHCMKVYVNRQNLKRHMKTYHGKTSFTCDVCNMNFMKKHLLSAHMYEHTLVKSFSCELCSREFITLREKKKHLKHHKTYSCELCDMAFVQWSKYLAHKKAVHIGTSEYQCDDCGRKFKKRIHIVHHVKVHNTRHTPIFYPCTYEKCARVYSRNSNLRQHIKMKHLKIKHDCDICCAKLSTKTKLMSHRKTKHENSKGHIIQPTKKTGRKDRYDIGACKTSTALKLAGLLTDPEDRQKMNSNIAANEQNNIVERKSEQGNSIADRKSEQDNIADRKSEQENFADKKPEQENIADRKSEQDIITDKRSKQDNNADKKSDQYKIDSKSEQGNIADTKVKQTVNVANKCVDSLKRKTIGVTVLEKVRA